jgi:hypothetical protein
MVNTVFNPHQRLARFSVPSQFIAKGLLLAMLGTLGASLGVAQLAPPAAAQEQSAAENAVQRQLLGQWQAKDPTSEEVFTFIFAPDNKLFVVLPAPEGTSVALQVEYAIDTTTQPMQLDIQLSPEQVAATIFEFTADGKLRLPLEGLEPGQPRQTAFKPNTTQFTKTSEATTVPEDIEVIELEAEMAKSSPEGEAKNYMYALTTVQQAHYLEQGNFANAIEDVSIGLRTETESYRYQIVPQRDNKKSVMVTATAKDATLPSYTGAVFVTRVDGKETTVAQICQTEQPSTSPPVMPQAPTRGSVEVQCPVGSKALQLQ